MVREISYGEAVNRRETNLNLSRAQKELIVKAILGKKGGCMSFKFVPVNSSFLYDGMVFKKLDMFFAAGEDGTYLFGGNEEVL
jgi:hypothetical protein